MTTRDDETEDETEDRERSVRTKRGKEFNLLHEEQVVARGIEIFGQKTVHGQSVDRTKQSVFQLIYVAEPAFTPLINNPFDEPLSDGAFTIWNNEHVLPAETDDTPHSKVRKIATRNYLKAANKQQINFDAKVLHVATSYNEGDNVGISIHEVDRTNTGAKLLPCKILSRRNTRLGKTVRTVHKRGPLEKQIPSSRHGRFAKCSLQSTSECRC